MKKTEGMIHGTLNSAMVNRLKIAALGLCVLLASTAQGQDSEAPSRRSSVMVYAGGGLHTMLYSVSGGKRESGNGGMAGAMYSLRIGRSWSLQSGLSAASYSSSSTLDCKEMCEFKDEVAGRGLPYVLFTKFRGFKEKQDVIALSVPVGLGYESSPEGRASFAMSWGVMATFPVSAKFKTTEGTITTMGCYDDLGYDLKDLPEHGFRTEEGRYSGTIETEPFGLGAYGEMGLYIRLGSGHCRLYLGGYANCGLKAFNKPKEVPIATLDEANNTVYAGTLCSVQGEKARLFAAGLKIGITLF